MLIDIVNGFLQNLLTYSRQTLAGLKQLKTFRLSHLRKAFSLMGKRERMALYLLLGIALISLFWSLRNFYYAHTELVPGRGGSYTEGMLGQPTYINPLLAYQETDLALINLVYSGLYRFDGNGNLISDLADGMPVISEDQKQYTINLKRGVKWHDGRDFTADDVIFTIQTLQDPAYKSPLRGLWLSTTAEKLSDYSVRFTTKDISGPFLYNLTLPIISHSTWGNVDPQNFPLSKYNLEAVGTGPYAIKEIKKLPSGKIQSLTLESFTDFYAGRPKIDTVTVNFYDTEEDILNALHGKEISGFGFVALGSNLYLEKDQDNFQIFSLPLPQYQVVFFNLNNKILSDQSVRKALSLATDRQKIVDNVFGNNAQVPDSPLVPDDSTSPTAPDLEAAKKLLDNAGWTVDNQTGLRAKKGAPLELTIATNDSLANSKAAEALANQWRQLNVKINLSILPTKQLNDEMIKPRAFDVLLFPQKLGADPDPFPFWHSNQTKDPGLNLTGFASAVADQLLAETRSNTDQAVRKDKYRQLDQILSDQIPAIYLSQTLYIYAISKDIKDVGLKRLYEPNQRFYDLRNWYINKDRVWR